MRTAREPLISYFTAAMTFLLFATNIAAAQITLTQATNFSVDAANDGRLAIDLLGGIWIVPPAGGIAESLATGLLKAERPKWSPNSELIVYQAKTANQDQLWLYRFADSTAENISDGQHQDQHPDWHPDGQRIVFSTDRGDSGFDLWELDLETLLTWRISHRDGDELEPAWSADGRDLVYVHQSNTQWSIVLRRHGQSDRILTTSTARLSVPQWRPDGSLITFLRHGDGNVTGNNYASIDMVILSEPLLIRPLLSGEDFFVAPVVWLDRQQFLYTANGVIQKRKFNSWTSSTVPFRAAIYRGDATRAAADAHRELPLIDAPTGQLVIRCARLFDGIGDGYQHNLDIVIEGGLIVAVEGRRDHPGAIVVDMGDLTVLPGYIDGLASLPANADDALGPLLLSFGVTTIVAEHDDAEALNQHWSGKAVPGPRVLRADNISSAETDSEHGLPWLVTLSGDLAAGVERRPTVGDWLDAGVPVLAESRLAGLGAGATMLLGIETLPASPRGRRYDDIAMGSADNPLTVVSGLANAQTEGLAELLQSRQHELLKRWPGAAQQAGTQPAFISAHSNTANAIVLGSKPNGLPPGIALHAEIRALAAAGLTPRQVLRATGVNAAKAFGLDLQLGRLAPGGAADLVLVDGDPLHNIADTQNIVAVVRNGRFFSAIGLIEQARDTTSVE